MRISILGFIIGCYLFLNWQLCLSQAVRVSITTANQTDTFYTGIPVYIGATAVDTNGIPFSFTGDIAIEKMSGIGSLLGTTSITCTNGKASFTNFYVDSAGMYTIKCTSSGLTDSEIITLYVKNCPYSKGANPATKLVFWDEIGDSVYSETSFAKYIFALDNNNVIDTNFNSIATLTQIGGSYTITNATNNKGRFTKGVGIAKEYYIDSVGTYSLACSYTGLISDTASMVISSLTSGNVVSCIVASPDKGSNLGLYGVLGNDFTFSKTTNRLFVASSTPNSLFYSDDTAQAWAPSFPYDSLEYNCGNSGWGGGAQKILTNHNGWALAYTQEINGSKKAAVLSFANGDTGTWFTMGDNNYIDDWTGEPWDINDISLSDYYAYAACGPFILLKNSSSQTLIDIRNYITGLASLSHAVNISAANNASGFPIYLVIDTIGTTLAEEGILYKYDGYSFSRISLPSSLPMIEKVYTHPGQFTGDTLFIAGTDASEEYLIFRSFDGGNNWQSIPYPDKNKMVELSDLDYCQSWVDSLPFSNGAILIIPYIGISKDLGVSWDTISGTDPLVAIHPQNISFVIKNMGGQVYSNLGVLGAASIKESYGLEAVQIKKIARTEKKGVFYLATHSGLAYTTAYLDTTVAYVDKWKPPYGMFPVNSVSSGNGYTAIAIDPVDSLHVITGFTTAIYLTFAGPDSFAPISPPKEYLNISNSLNDVVFVSTNPLQSEIILAVKGGEEPSTPESGSLWRSGDGGINWSKAIADTFSSGNAIAVAYASDTVVYMASGGKFVNGSGKLWKSTNFGETWVQVNNGPNCTRDPSVTSIAIRDIATLPGGTSNELYLVGSYYDCNAFAYTNDGGFTYQYINLPNDSQEITSIAVKHDDKDIVYVGVGREVYVYDALLDTIYMKFRGLPGELIPDIVSGSILVGTTTGFYGVEQDAGIITTLPKMQNEMIAGSSVLLYPNPTDKNITLLYTSTLKGDAAIAVFDIIGNKLISISALAFEKGENKIELPVEKLSAGTYYLKINGPQINEGSSFVIVK